LIKEENNDAENSAAQGLILSLIQEMLRYNENMNMGWHKMMNFLIFNRSKLMVLTFFFVFF